MLLGASPELDEHAPRRFEVVGRGEQVAVREAGMPKHPEMERRGLERQRSRHRGRGIPPEQRLGHRQRGQRLGERCLIAEQLGVRDRGSCVLRRCGQVLAHQEESPGESLLDLRAQPRIVLRFCQRSPLQGDAAANVLAEVTQARLHGQERRPLDTRRRPVDEPVDGLGRTSRLAGLEPVAGLGDGPPCPFPVQVDGCQAHGEHHQLGGRCRGAPREGRPRSTLDVRGHCLRRHARCQGKVSRAFVEIGGDDLGQAAVSILVALTVRCGGVCRHGEERVREPQVVAGYVQDTLDHCRSERGRDPITFDGLERREVGSRECGGDGQGTPGLRWECRDPGAEQRSQVGRELLARTERQGPRPARPVPAPSRRRDCHRRARGGGAAPAAGRPRRVGRG